MNNQTALQSNSPDSIIERVVIQGDLKALSPADRSAYYAKVCDSIGLNPFTRPFEYITLNSKLTLYARKDATDQLRKIHTVSIQIVSRERQDDAYVVTARATDKHGRTDESIGAVSIGSLKGDALCNAIMKAETKAKRRVTLSICGLGFLDETEVETIPGAQIGEFPQAPPATVHAFPQQPQVIEAEVEAPPPCRNNRRNNYSVNPIARTAQRHRRGRSVARLGQAYTRAAVRRGGRQAHGMAGRQAGCLTASLRDAAAHP